ncbi:type I restriction endonuclease subunit S [Rhizobium sp. NLR10a]|uniref:restriction endonuclease subunit S n=1 Tax=unclassified Rhizobium TaxID=2613769 RepID=UPI001C83327C|nr:MULTISPECIES: restriction endonuclease subunit S [unclassified Rhizobium]MBX5214392.1 type I restriction endonuclease subunit S [Rhizobium sp. NLR9a]MBX5273683.1 type I restriction endonuclease subunit S [Rhizobium sp. NLR13a]MBX5279767.1 type I restriction endonuclease subunit S [Rhizobium sp. NLR10a]MBX5291681.1 type I restriction endonuclease subunit S [Rhizobium sp. NLR15a]
MNAERLLHHYETIADAPDAIARLRRFILDLAVRGKLAPQDPNDEPASELLRRIAKEKARLVKAGEISKFAESKPAMPSDLTFEIPAQWQPAKIENVLDELQTGPFGSSLHQSDYRTGGTPVVNPASIQGEQIKPIEKMAVDAATLERLASFKLRRGDVVMARRGEMGRCAIVTEREAGWLCGTGSLILRPSKLIYPNFLVLLIGSPFSRQYLGGTAVGTTMQNLNQSILLKLPFGLPPLDEQHRIVAKVDELMALCDQLEAARTARETTRDQLAAASLARLNSPDPETFCEDARFALEALPALTARPDQIKQLRQTILNLAVRGKLVPQDPADEPAAELLKRIEREKALTKSRNSDKTNKLPTTPEDLPFDLPRGWVRIRLGQIIILLSGQHLQPPEYSEVPGAGVPYITGPSDFGATGLTISRYALVRKAVAKQGQLLLTVKGSGVGKTAICNLREVAISRQLMSLTPISWNLEFLEIITHRLAEALQEQARSLIPGIAREDVENFTIGLPPLTEQHRIVAKVEELMALCDQLEASLRSADDTSRKLLDALLAEALAPVDEQTLQEAAA